MSNFMRIGVRAHDFGKQNEQVLANMVRAAGFETVQLALQKAIEGIDNLFDVDDGRIQNIRNSFESAKVGIDVFGCYIEPSLENDSQRKEQVDIFLRGIDIAHKLGVSLIATETTRFSGNEELRDKAYERLKSSVTQFVTYASNFGINVGIEPVVSHTLNNVRLAKRLVDEVASPYIKIVLDPVNLLNSENISNQDNIINEAFELVGEHIAAIHIKDVSEDIAWRPLGEGCVNLALIFERIKSLGRDLPILREIALPQSRDNDINVMRKLCGIG